MTVRSSFCKAVILLTVEVKNGNGHDLLLP